MITFKLPKELPTTACVFEISIGDKYYIGKSSNLLFVKTEIQTTYGKYNRKGLLETNLFYPVAKEIHKQEKPIVEIKVLFASSNGYDVLKFELCQLSEHFGQKNCLNLNNIPHIPKTVIAKKGSNWLTQNQALNFRKLLTKYNY